MQLSESALEAESEFPEVVFWVGLFEEKLFVNFRRIVDLE